jgi:hypothetical protein
MLLHMDGFDEYTVIADLQMEYFVVGGTVQITGGRYGTGGVLFGNYGTGFARALPSDPTDMWAGFAVNPTPNVNSNNTFQLMNFIGNNGSCIFITYDYTTSLFQVWQSQGGSAAVALGYSAQLFVPGAWHWVEARCKLGTTTGIVELWVDNVQILNLTGLNTNVNASASFTTFVVGSIGAPGTSTPFLGTYDDLYILDTTGSVNNTRLGDSRIETRIPISDAAPNNGTPSTAGPHYLMVDELQWSSAHNITLDNVDNQEELFNMSPLVTNPATIFATRAITIMEKSDGGTMTGATVTSSGGTVAVGPTTPGLNIWCHIDGIQELDPNTSAAWTKDAVNACQVGFKITT